MANTTLEVACKTEKNSSGLAGYTPQVCACELVRCGDCGRMVSSEKTYHSQKEDKYYCLGNCLTEHLDSVE